MEKRQIRRWLLLEKAVNDSFNDFFVVYLKKMQKKNEESPETTINLFNTGLCLNLKKIKKDILMAAEQGVKNVNKRIDQNKN